MFVLVLALAQLKHTWGRTLALLLVISLATASFTVLTQVVETNRLQVRGTIAANFRSSYDLLVRPVDSYTSRETEQGLVRPNYQSGIFGGITQANLDSIRSVPGVEVAAPVSNLGYVSVQSSVRVDLRPLLDPDATQQLFRIRPTFTMDRGLSRFTAAPVLVYVSRNRAILGKAGGDLGLNGEKGDPIYTERVPGRSASLPACVNYRRDQVAEQRRRDKDRSGSTAVSPWGYRDPYVDTATGMRCYYLPTPPSDSGAYGADDPSRLEAVIPVSIPVLLTAVDPVAENRISGLDRALVTGRALSDRVGPPPAMHQSNGQTTDVPVLAATSISVDQQVDASIERLRAVDDQLTQTLAHPDGLVSRLDTLPGDTVRQLAPTTAQSAWEQAVSQRATTAPGEGLLIGSYWQVGPSTYAEDHGDLAVQGVPNPPVSYVNSATNRPGPVGSDDRGVREVTGKALFAGAERIGELKVVGRFDPTKVFPDQTVSGLISPTYQSPILTGADPASRAALQGEALAPSSNVAGYAAQPPSLLTTLPAARFLLSSGSYNDPTYHPEELGSGTERPDPISVVRVRVAGITGPDPVSRERLNQAAMAIELRTSLAVDIVAGSSGVPTDVRLPAGGHGRPELRLDETWARKGLAYTIVSAVDRKSLALFVLILTVCALVVANAVSTAVRTRRTGLGVLACLGWSARRLFGVMIAELAVVGLAAGLLGAGTAFTVGAAGGPDITWQRSLLAVPPAVLLAVLMGLVPAARASRVSPMAAVRPLARTSRCSVRVRTVAGLALNTLARTPGRTALAALSLALGIGALAVLLCVHQVFRGLVVGSLLGDAVVLNIRTPDLIALTTIIALGGVAVVDVVYLSVREQSVDLAMLRSTGWSNAALVRLVAAQGLGVGILGGAGGALLGALAVLTLTGSLSAAIVEPVGIALSCGVALATTAALGPALLIHRLATAPLLSQDES